MPITTSTTLSGNQPANMRINNHNTNNTNNIGQVHNPVGSGNNMFAGSGNNLFANNRNNANSQTPVNNIFNNTSNNNIFANNTNQSNQSGNANNPGNISQNGNNLFTLGNNNRNNNIFTQNSTNTQTNIQNNNSTPNNNIFTSNNNLFTNNSSGNTNSTNQNPTNNLFNQNNQINQNNTSNANNQRTNNNIFTNNSNLFTQNNQNQSSNNNQNQKQSKNLPNNNIFTSNNNIFTSNQQGNNGNNYQQNNNNANSIFTNQYPLTQIKPFMNPQWIQKHSQLIDIDDLYQDHIDNLDIKKSFRFIQLLTEEPDLITWITHLRPIMAIAAKDAHELNLKLQGKLYNIKSQLSEDQIAYKKYYNNSTINTWSTNKMTTQQQQNTNRFLFPPFNPAPIQAFPQPRALTDKEIIDIDSRLKKVRNKSNIQLKKVLQLKGIIVRRLRHLVLVNQPRQEEQCQLYTRINDLREDIKLKMENFRISIQNKKNIHPQTFKIYTFPHDPKPEPKILNRLHEETTQKNEDLKKTENQKEKKISKMITILAEGMSKVEKEMKYQKYEMNEVIQLKEKDDTYKAEIGRGNKKHITYV